ncbi:hypothetical protein P5V15_013748 [Pogonomyrmex californicus]
MFSAIFVFGLIAVHVAAKIPSYINVCGRRDPNINQCILDNINNLKSKICEGLPDLDIPPNDPFIIDKIVISDTPNIKLYIRNAQVSGLCDFTIKSLHADIDNLNYDVDLLFHEIRGNTISDFNISLLSTPIAYKGQLYIAANNIEAKVHLNFKIVTNNGKRYTYLAKMKLNLIINDHDVQYNIADEKQTTQLIEIVQNFVGNNIKEIIEVFKPSLEEIVSKRIISLANDIVKHFTYEELFPERS